MSDKIVNLTDRRFRKALVEDITERVVARLEEERRSFYGLPDVRPPANATLEEQFAHRRRMMALAKKDWRYAAALLEELDREREEEEREFGSEPA